MSFFQPALVPQLFVGQNPGGNVGLVVAVIPSTASSSGFEIPDAIQDKSLNASIVFLQEPLSSVQADQQAFVDKVLQLAEPTLNDRILMWVSSDTGLTSGSATPNFVGLTWPLGTGGVQTNGALAINIGPTLTLTMGSGMTLAPTEVDVTFSGAFITFSGLSAPSGASSVTAATVPFTGSNLGCLQFEINLTQTSLAGTLNMGFEFFFPSDAASGPAILMLQAPLVTPDPGRSPGFNASFDPLDPFNTFSPNRTALMFSGTDLNGNLTTLNSCYSTTSGQAITFTPISQPDASEQLAGLVFTSANSNLQPANSEYLALAPVGDFVLSLPGVTSTQTLLCGLQGTEYLVFQPQGNGNAGDRLRFIPQCHAYAPTFPFPVSSPVLAPVDNTLLDGTYVTSWATLLPAVSTSPIQSVAQPPGFNLFGHDADIYSQNPNLMGSVDPATTLKVNPTLAYPLVPFSNVASGDGIISFTQQQIQEFETQVISPTRHSVITSLASGGTLSAQSKLASKFKTGTVGDPVTSSVTTPSGFLVELQQTGSDMEWTSILLGQILETNQEFGFNNPTLTLQQAFQTGQLFLVVANNLNLGTLGGTGTGPTFANSLTMGDWTLIADVGEDSTFSDYANVMIVKGMPGKLYDPTQDNSANLVSSPSKWTSADTFASPTTISNSVPDPTQHVNLSQWLQSYFQEAATNPDTYYFNDFNKIARDYDWTGVIVLKGQIGEIPPGLNGIMAGVTDPSAFNVHHMAVALSSVKNGPTGPVLSQSSSVYGLIYYLDPSANPADPSAPLPASTSAPYDFRLLSLKVLFENTAVKSFSSYAQLNLQNILGIPVLSMGLGGNSYNAIVLQGTYQLVDNQPIYSLASVADSVFMLNSNVLNRVEMTGVTMSTVQADPTGLSISDFSFTGYLDFALVPGNSSPIDIFSFGNQSGQQLPFQGLAFQDLILSMSYPTETPNNRTFILSTDSIRFDLQTSTVRPNSLVPSLGLTVQNLVNGNSSTTLSQLGYLPVTLDFRSGSLGKQWYGLNLKLNLGTPGDLASNAGFDAALILAWSTQSTGTNFGIQVGLNLPGTAQGAPLISLQNVLKLSIGQTFLTYNTSDQAYLLMLNEMALCFMNVLKIPPNGSSSFYLFGGPTGATDGLGWFAAYNKEPKTQSSAKALVSSSTKATEAETSGHL